MAHLIIEINKLWSVTSLRFDTPTLNFTICFSVILGLDFKQLYMGPPWVLAKKKKKIKHFSYNLTLKHVDLQVYLEVILIHVSTL